MIGSQPLREGRIAVPGGTVWYGWYGAGATVPLVVVHGGPGLSHDYLLPLASLATERPVVFYDQLGGGRSACADDPALWRLERFVAELRAVCQALAPQGFHLLGHSWGSILAVELALQQPPALRSLILASPVLSVPRYVSDLRAMGATSHSGAPPAESAPPGWAVYRALWGASEAAPTGELATYDRTAALARIAVPTLLTCGEHDPATPAATAVYAAHLPRAAVRVFAGCGHLPHLEAPAPYLSVVRAFLRRVEG